MGTFTYMNVFLGGLFFHIMRVLGAATVFMVFEIKFFWCFHCLLCDDIRGL